MQCLAITTKFHSTSVIIAQKKKKTTVLSRSSETEIELPPVSSTLYRHEGKNEKETRTFLDIPRGREEPLNEKGFDYQRRIRRRPWNTPLLGEAWNFLSSPGFPCSPRHVFRIEGETSSALLPSGELLECWFTPRRRRDWEERGRKWSFVYRVCDIFLLVNPNTTVRISRVGSRKYLNVYTYRIEHVNLKQIKKCTNRKISIAIVYLIRN